MFRMLIVSFFLFFNQVVLAHPLSSKPIVLKAVETSIIVNEKLNRVFDIVQPNGTKGYVGIKGHYFDVLLKNETTVPISIHWHGLILPNDQDGVPYVTQLPIQPGNSHHYHFKILQAGTFWMHSHYQFHEQKLMAAPLILKDPQDPYVSFRDVTIMLQDFTFKNPETIFYHLQHKKSMKKKSIPDLNDVEYDAYIANRRTLKNPEIVRIKPNEKIRLRLINAASASNFWIDTGKLKVKAIAVDGNTIKTIEDTHFQIAIAQRMDLVVVIPKSGGAFPILAEVEGTKKRTGIILATPRAIIPHINEEAEKVAPALNDHQEQQLHSINHFSIKPVNTLLKYDLTGDMSRYIWKINNQVWPHITPYKIKQGDRIEMLFINNTSMSHPMHFHGHVFQVTEIDGKKLQNGPMRDTILVLPHSSKKIILDANNPGIWMTHCHVLYHMLAGMMTTTNYQNYPEPLFYQELIENKR